MWTDLSIDDMSTVPSGKSLGSRSLTSMGGGYRRRRRIGANRNLNLIAAPDGPGEHNDEAVCHEPEA